MCLAIVIVQHINILIDCFSGIVGIQNTFDEETMSFENRLRIFIIFLTHRKSAKSVLFIYVVCRLCSDVVDRFKRLYLIEQYKHYNNLNALLYSAAEIN